jgi:ABC-type Fe3+/spermidine/putrescine transport system ATPase subunit
MIKLDRVKKRFGKKEVLSDITLEVRKREIVSLVGPNGCGKTTTLNIIAGLSHADGGTVTIGNEVVEGRLNGRFVHVDPSKRKVGYVFQDYALFPHMTARRNIAYGLKARHLPQEQIRERTAAMLAFVGLQDHAEHYPGQLSGGQKQRVALARALATEPEVLLLDEPLAALDQKLRESLRSELKSLLNSLNVTVIYVTHELAEANELSNRIAVMEAGRIEQIGQRGGL